MFKSKLINEMINFNDAKPQYQEIHDKIKLYRNGYGSFMILFDLNLKKFFKF